MALFRDVESWGEKLARGVAGLPFSFDYRRTKALPYRSVNTFFQRKPPPPEMGFLENDLPGRYERELGKSFDRFDIVKKGEYADYLYLRRFYIFHPKYPKSLSSTTDIMPVLQGPDFHLEGVEDFLNKAQTELSNPRVYIHHILVSDQDRHFHDHPWNYGVYLLKGAYLEDMPGKSNFRMEGGFRFQRATQLHKISRIVKDTWTLFVCEAPSREWGFKTDKGWVSWSSYQGV